MIRCVVNVATTSYYQRGQARLRAALAQHSPDCCIEFHQGLPPGSPSHRDHNYVFKAYALQQAAANADVLLWCDASILPVRSLEPLWERIEHEGYWFSHCGWNNYQWTADEAYPELFGAVARDLPAMRAVNEQIPHVATTAFGVCLGDPMGFVFLREFYRYATQTRAFHGPWINAAAPNQPESNDPWRKRVCGPPDVFGHRHDQTVASVIAWRLGMQLTRPPDIFAYKGGETEATILVADGSYK